MNDLATTENKSSSTQELSTQTENPYLGMMNQLIEKGNFDQMEKLMDMQERWEANEARKAFVKAMAQFKENAPELVKDRKGHNSNYASLAQVATKTAEVMGHFGLSHSFKMFQEGASITVTCVVTHNLGHAESVSLTAAPDTSGSKNAIQAIGSTVSYLERYTLCASTGLAARDMDDDGAASNKKPAAEIELITDKQIQEIQKLCMSKKVPADKILKAYQLSDLTEISTELFPTVIKKLKATPEPKKPQDAAE